MERRKACRVATGKRNPMPNVSKMTPSTCASSRTLPKSRSTSSPLPTATAPALSSIEFLYSTLHVVPGESGGSRSRSAPGAPSSASLLSAARLRFWLVRRSELPRPSSHARARRSSSDSAGSFGTAIGAPSGRRQVESERRERAPRTLTWTRGTRPPTRITWPT